MKSHFSPEFFRGNRQKLQSLFTGTAPIVITANGLMQRNSDTAYPFRQDSNFWYLTGINEPDIILVIDKGKEYLIVPERESSREAFDGSIDATNLQAVSGIEVVLSHKAGWRQLGPRIKRVQHVATLAPPATFVEQLGLYTNPARQRLIDTLKTYSESIELLDLRPQLTRQRSIKQPEELAALQSAIDITVKTFKLAQRHLEKFSHEYEVEAMITAEFRKQDVGHGYQPIVAGGLNACTLHYVQNNMPLNAKQLLLLDVGAEVENYSADITRTYSLSKPTKRQQQVFDTVLEVQEYAKSLLKPGIIIKEYEKLIEQFMGEKLRNLGLIKTISHETVRKYYPHATSHFLGLDVHDIGDYEQPLESGMVLTIEPGIYIPEEGIGVRVEDDVLVTDAGVKVLTARLPQRLS